MLKFLSQHKTLVAVVIIVLAIPAAALGYWLISPYFDEDEVNEEFPDDITVVSATDRQATIDAAAAVDVPVSEDMPDEMEDDNSNEVTAIEVRRGQFRDIDSVHQGSGDAILFQLSDGRHLLRFENFRVTNGPDLHVYLVPLANRTGGADVTGYVDLGQLQGNVGAQNYFIPADVEIGEEASIVIWCEPFRVTFSIATLDVVN